MIPKWLRNLALIACIGLVIAIVFRTLTPPPKGVPETAFITMNKNQTKSSFAGLVYQGSPLTPPPELPIAQATNSDQASQVEAALIRAFSLTPHQRVKTIWNGPTYSLIFNSQNQTYELTKNTSANTSGTALSLADAASKAEAFLTTYLPAYKVKPLPNQARFFSNHEEHYEEVPANEAQHILLPLAYTIKDIPVFFSYQEDFPFLLTIDETGTIIKAVITPFISQPTEVDMVPTISVEAALSNVTTLNRGSVIGAYHNGSAPVELSQISAGQLKTVALEYRLDETNGLIYPFYRFSGTLVNASGTEMIADVITPAVHVQKR